MAKEIIPNEVIIVGEVRKGKESVVIDINLPQEEQLKLMMDKFKFTRDTNPSDEAKKAGFQSGKFFHIRMSGLGDMVISLPDGRTVKRSSATGKPGFDTLFQSGREITFLEIREELLEKNENGVPTAIEIVGGDPNAGLIKLKNYALMGIWDEFPAGFKFTPHNYKDGKLVPLMSYPRENNYKPTPAVAQTCYHFVYEDQFENLEGRREIIRDRVKKWKIAEPTDNTDAQQGAPQVVTAATETTEELEP